jgi:hypothetical protein
MDGANSDNERTRALALVVLSRMAPPGTGGKQTGLPTILDADELAAVARFVNSQGRLAPNGAPRRADPDDENALAPVTRGAVDSVRAAKRAGMSREEWLDRMAAAWGTE